MYAVCSPEMHVYLYQTTRCHTAILCYLHIVPGFKQSDLVTPVSADTFEMLLYTEVSIVSELIFDSPLPLKFSFDRLFIFLFDRILPAS